MEKCKKCNSKKIKESVKNLSKETNDNVVYIYKCEDCGYEETDVKHIG